MSSAPSPHMICSQRGRTWNPGWNQRTRGYLGEDEGGRVGEHRAVTDAGREMLQVVEPHVDAVFLADGEEGATVRGGCRGPWGELTRGRGRNPGTACGKPERSR